MQNITKYTIIEMSHSIKKKHTRKERFCWEI